MVTVEQNYLHQRHPPLTEECLSMSQIWLKLLLSLQWGEGIPIVDDNCRSESSTLETSSLTEECLSVSNMVGIIDVTTVLERERQLKVSTMLSPN
ncbi:hypothetical protein CDAR_66811 [Caerostris darwini]|uniref:Uncharacterized protein n=1 Tax=Caerostris darwini TaxID=1538125 RepID=A0AAV4VWI9_9ARAC|nr:hypothetical protein CDAR_66811 [Caerostris darwini]